MHGDDAVTFSPYVQVGPPVLGPSSFLFFIASNGMTLASSAGGVLPRIRSEIPQTDCAPRPAHSPPPAADWPCIHIGTRALAAERSAFPTRVGEPNFESVINGGLVHDWIASLCVIFFFRNPKKNYLKIFLCFHVSLIFSKIFKELLQK